MNEENKLVEARVLFDRAIECIDRNHLDEAELLLDQAYNLAPDRPSIIQNLALLKLNVWKLDEAHALFGKMREYGSETDEVQSYIDLIEKYNSLDIPDLSADDYQSAVRETIDLIKPGPINIPLIRIGGDNDGGYLVPDDLADIDGCFSPGVSTVATFEEMLAEQYQIPCFMADYSVDAAPAEHKLFDFEKKFLGIKNDDVFIRLEDWIERKERSYSFGDLVLQMDIEGDEYKVIADTSIDTLKRFRIIIIEFHQVNKIFMESALPYYHGFFKKITKYHSVVHIHPNNCCGIGRKHGISVPRVLEMTLLRTDRFIPSDRKLEFPHHLDQKNVVANSDIVLPSEWY